jgi:hypothetical protein
MKKRRGPRPVYAFNPDGKLFEFANVSQASNAIYPELDKPNGTRLRLGINSPVDSKILVRGWAVFYDEGDRYTFNEIRPKERKRPGKKAIPVTAYTRSGKVLASYPSILDAAKINGTSTARIRYALNNRVVVNDIVFCLSEEGFVPATAFRRPHKTKLKAYDPEGKLHKFDSLVAASESVTGKRGRETQIKLSMLSPNHHKSTVLGWVFFPAEYKVPAFHQITKVPMTSRRRNSQ